MCLGIPGEVISVADRDGLPFGEVRFGDVTREVCLTCHPDVVPGDFVTIKEALRNMFAKPQPERLIANVRVGLAQGEQSASAHVPGVKQGNAPARGRRSNLEREAGIHSDPNGGARATARRSTGINAKAHNPIDPRMPNLPPP